MAAAAGLAACLGIVSGCGNTYRPVLATIGAVGPAGQPQKYAVAVSSPTLLAPAQSCPAGTDVVHNGLLTLVDFSGDTVLVTATLGQNPYYFALNASGTTGYTLNCDKTLNSFDISPSLISSQVLESTLPPGANPVSVYAPSGSTYLADPGVFAVDQLTGTPPALKQELPTPNGYSPIYVVGQSGSARTYAIGRAVGGGTSGVIPGGPGVVSAIETGNNTISATLPVGRGPVYGVMTADQRRAFILNQTDGTVSVINTQNNALDQFLPSSNISGFSISNGVVTFSGTNPFGVGTTFTVAGLSAGTYLNGQTFTVLPAGLTSTQFEASFAHANVVSTSDSGTATGTVLTSTIPVGVAPVWADLASGLDELIVANQGDGTTPGSVTIISIPLCSATALPTNPNCNSANPIDATTFGQMVATNITVGINPIMVSVLSDFTRAYVANAGNPALPCAANGVPVAGVSTTCTISVINLTSNTVTATIPMFFKGQTLGHPIYIATTNATPTGKVYVVSKDSQVMTVIETETDSVDTTVPLQGYGVSVRMTAQ